MTNRPILLHIGYHKTATSWLQRVFFVPENSFYPLMTQNQVDQSIIKPHTLNFDPSEFEHFIRDLRSTNHACEVDVISSEMISGNPFYGGRESCEYAQRLQRAIPDARILITIRNQLKILPSVYMQYLSRGGTNTPEKFFDSFSELGYFGFAVEHFYYHVLVDYYRNLFGGSNVLVATHECLSRNPASFAEKICNFSGNQNVDYSKFDTVKRSGVSQPEYASGLLRRANYFRSGPVSDSAFLEFGNSGEFLYRGIGFISRTKSLNRILQNRKPVSRYVQNTFQGKFRESNKLLQNAVQEDLGALGYEI